MGCRKFADWQERMFLQTERKLITQPRDPAIPGDAKVYTGPKKKHV
jgi:hypothetical protein